MISDDLIKDNNEYWDERAQSYSDVNKEELAGDSRASWKAVLRSTIGKHTPGRVPEDIRILDAGTGPGFFAIILTELGYDVTAVDMSAGMLAEAASNAGGLEERIDFRIMDAADLEFEDASFDVVVSRNLTWNLPDPDKAYREWRRVLKPGGLLINFDANWYSYLFDNDARKAFESDRKNSSDLGLEDQNVGDNFDVMEEIAGQMPLSSVTRPAWDLGVLSGLGFDAQVDENIWMSVWTHQEKINFASTPMFMITAVKQQPGRLKAVSFG